MDTARETSPEEVRVGAARFRDAMSRVAGAVHVVTAVRDAGRAGFTATAVTAVSDRPPTLLVCANAGSTSARALIEAGAFCVNTLAWEDSAIANAFSGQAGLRGEERFALGRWTSLTTGSPVLETALVSFDCRMIDATLVGTHHIIVGEVVDTRVGLHRRALVYRERAYHGV